MGHSYSLELIITDDEFKGVAVANAGMVPVSLFQVATIFFSCSPPQLNLE
jgi:hypothetical protein